MTPEEQEARAAGWRAGISEAADFLEALSDLYEAKALRAIGDLPVAEWRAKEAALLHAVDCLRSWPADGGQPLISFPKANMN